MTLSTEGVISVSASPPAAIKTATGDHFEASHCGPSSSLVLVACLVEGCKSEGGDRGPGVEDGSMNGGKIYHCG